MSLLIKRKPHLGWFIYFLAILLACLLMMNSLFGSIYVNQLKKKILVLSDNYFLAQRDILEMKEALTNIHSNIYKFALTNNNQKIEKEKKKYSELFLNHIRKDSTTVVAYSKEIVKLNIDSYMSTQVRNITPIILDYTQSLKDVLEVSMDDRNVNAQEILSYLKMKEEDFNKIMFNLEILSRLVQDKALSIKISDDLLLEYLPSVFILTFFAAAITGGSFIYVSRREVRKSILENTQNILHEAREYQMDCIETLEICKELSEKNSKLIIDKYQSIENINKDSELMTLLEKFNTYSTKIELAFEIRRHLHEREKKNIEKALEDGKNKLKSII